MTSMRTSSESLAMRCPSWCVLRHGRYQGEEDLVHVSEARFVRNTMVRICMTMDHETGRRDGPFVLLGTDEYSLDEAAALVDVLRDLLSLGRVPTPRVGS
jgi:hypothetical protein